LEGTERCFAVKLLNAVKHQFNALVTALGKNQFGQNEIYAF
jgi:hypothetical protein